jgi:hypothetical protein
MERLRNIEEAIRSGTGQQMSGARVPDAAQQVDGMLESSIDELRLIATAARLGTVPRVIGARILALPCCAELVDHIKQAMMDIGANAETVSQLEIEPALGEVMAWLGRYMEDREIAREFADLAYDLSSWYFSRTTITAMRWMQRGAKENPDEEQAPEILVRLAGCNELAWETLDRLRNADPIEPLPPRPQPQYVQRPQPAPQMPAVQLLVQSESILALIGELGGLVAILANPRVDAELAAISRDPQINEAFGGPVPWAATFSTLAHAGPTCRALVRELNQLNKPVPDFVRTLANYSSAPFVLAQPVPQPLAEDTPPTEARNSPAFGREVSVPELRQLWEYLHAAGYRNASVTLTGLLNCQGDISGVAQIVIERGQQRGVTAPALLVELATMRDAPSTPQPAPPPHQTDPADGTQNPGTGEHPGVPPIIQGFIQMAGFDPAGNWEQTGETEWTERTTTPATTAEARQNSQGSSKPQPAPPPPPQAAVPPSAADQAQADHSDDETQGSSSPATK